MRDAGRPRHCHTRSGEPRYVSDNPLSHAQAGYTRVACCFISMRGVGGRAVQSCTHQGVRLLKNQASKRITFGKIPETIEAPDLLNIQLESWESFLQARDRCAGEWICPT